ncbi:hypothetical protein V9W64_10575 [Neisseria leonii]|uniref:Uncharacterized protein n=1 Tax=Neisseria leonii TaxID=2995413 RepID=A0A9X4E6K8_9NEIS|nr:hypothetical protein [Neisseria sp. 51.81]MDD9328232.1 hypothetical protein [Neisseria sp. 51.81]
MMLNQPYTETETVQAAAAVPATAPAQPAVPAIPNPRFSSPLQDLVGYFQREAGMYVLPAGASTPCTVIGSSIKLGKDMVHDAGDYIAIEPVNLTPYLKLKLGVPAPTTDEKKLQVNCYDGKTVMLDDVSYGKDEYLAMIKSRGYDKAKWDEQAVLHGMYLGCEREAKIKLGEDDKLMSIYLSKSSYNAWKSFLVKTSLTKAPVRYLKLTKISNSSGTFNWTQFDFERYEPADEAQAA